MPKLQLTLYISGKTARSERTIASLRRMLDEQSGIDYELSICDVVEEPQTAEKEKVLATPTLVLVSPPPPRRIVGDLFPAEKVLVHLGLSSLASPAGETAS